MDTKSLLDYFQALFVLEREEGGINVTAIAITPAYGDAVPNSFILGVSSPSLEGRGCSDKTDTIINLLYDKAGFEQRSMIDRVRVYESIDEIRRHSQAYFQPGLAMYCEMPVMDEERSRQLAVSE